MAWLESTGLDGGLTPLGIVWSRHVFEKRR